MPQMVKNMPAVKETWVQSLGGEDPLEKEMVTHRCNILAWEIPWTEEPGRLQSTELQRVGHHNLVTEHQYHKRGSPICDPTKIHKATFKNPAWSTVSGRAGTSWFQGTHWKLQNDSTDGET